MAASKYDLSQDEKIAELEEQIAGLVAVLSDENERVAALEEQVTQMSARLDKAADVVGSLQSQRHRQHSSSSRGKGSARPAPRPRATGVKCLNCSSEGKVWHVDVAQLRACKDGEDVPHVPQPWEQETEESSS